MNRTRVLLALVLLATALLPFEAVAQLIRGQFVEEETGAPVVGGFIALFDSEGTQVAGALTQPTGRFLLRVPGPGRWRIRGERIGFEGVERTVQITGEEGVDLILAAPTRAIQLEGIVARADRRCRVRPEAGAAAAVLWDEARKALSSVGVSGADSIVPVQLLSWERELDGRTLLIRSEQRRVRQGFTLDPVRSLSAEDLAEYGYIRQEGGRTIYHGPDMLVLLSDSFQNAHCFVVREGERRTDSDGLIGLGFEPIGNALPDVAGTLWLDPETAELRFLEYGYSRYPQPLEETGNLGGRVEFDRRADGRWIVRRWWIRTPRAILSPPRNSGRRASVQTIWETGGEVSDARPDGGWTLPGLRGAIEGEVRDDILGSPLEGAFVYLSGTGFSTTTAPDGSFRLEGVRPGRYGIAFTHAWADRLGYRPPLQEITVEGGAVLGVKLAVPLSALADEACRGTDGAVLYGTVREEGSGIPLVGVRVVAGWSSWELDTAGLGTRIREAGSAVEGTTDDRGVFRLCGLDVDRSAVEVAALGESGEAGPRQTVRVEAGAIVGVELTLPAPRNDPPR